MGKPAWISQEVWDDMEAFRRIADANMERDLARIRKRIDIQMLGPVIADMLERVDEAQN